jgi:WD40 repeat protein
MTDFISYSRADTYFVQKLHSRLQEDGRDIWVDWEDIPLTADWWNEIQEGIEGSDTFLFIISPDSVASEVCRKEIEHAVDRHKRLIPILYRDVERSQQADLHPSISSHNWIFFREEDDFDEALKKLTVALNTDLDYLREHTRLLIRAIEWNTQNRDNGFLLNRKEMLRAEEWLTTSMNRSPSPTELHTEYILASKRIENRRQRTLLSGVSIGLVVALSLAVISLLLFRTAEQERVRAVSAEATAVYAHGIAETRGNQASSLALAANARNIIREGSPNRGLALAIEAFNVNQPPMADIQQTVAQAIYGAGARFRLEGHGQSVVDVAFTPDGKYGISIASDGTMIQWDITTGQQTGGAGSMEVANALSYLPDGRSIVMGTLDGVLILLDLSTGTEIRRFTGHDAAITSLDVTQDGQRILSGSIDRTLRLWDVTTGEALLTIESPGIVLDVELSADGRYAVSGSGDRFEDTTRPDNVTDRSVRVWDLESGEEYRHFAPESGFVRAITYSPDGKYVASGTWSSGKGGRIHLWNIAENELEATYFGHTDIISDLTFSTDNNILYSGSWDGTLRVWDVETGIEAQRFDEPSDRILALAVSPDNQFVLTGTGNFGGGVVPNPAVDNSRQPSVWIWDMENRAQALLFTGHEDWVWAVDINAEGRLAASGSGPLNPPIRDSNIRIWDLATAQQIGLLEGHTNTVQGINFHPTEDRLVSGSWDNSARIWTWEIDSNGQISQYENLTTYTGHNDRVLSVAFNAAGTQVLSSSRDQSIHLWDADTGELIRRFDGHTASVNRVLFTPDDRYVLSASDDRTVRLWDIETAALVHTFIGHSDSVNNIAINPEGTQLLSVSTDTSVRLWSLEDFNAPSTQIIGHNRAVYAVAFSPDGKTALTGGSDLTIRLWDIESKQEIRRLTGHTNWILSVVFSADGRFALSGAEDNTVRLWRLERTLQELIDWGRRVRYVPEITCADRAQYNIEPHCSDEAAPEGEPAPLTTGETLDEEQGG